MTVTIAIQPDEVLHRNGERQSYSERWQHLAAQRGLGIKQVDVYASDAIEQIGVCDAFMWRCPPSAQPRALARRLLPSIEAGLGIPLFPDWKTAWHFEDKIAQHYLLSLAGIPTPATEVFWTRQHAEAFCNHATYPFVLKLASGYQASNVRRVDDRAAALYYIQQLFGPGRVSLGYRPASALRQLLRRGRTAAQVLRGDFPNSPTTEAELHWGYFYAQEFLPDNAFDTRITIIGNRAFAFRRFNRPDDFRASGSGHIDWNPEPIDNDDVRLAFEVARRLGTQTVAVDVLRKDGRPLIVELTLSYASWVVRDCPGHWTLSGAPDTGDLAWQAGSMEPADAIFEDFVRQLPLRSLCAYSPA